jgi:hypothetical protein
MFVFVHGCTELDISLGLHPLYKRPHTGYGVASLSIGIAALINYQLSNNL